MIRHILFDLDNTLYSARYGLEEFYFERVAEFTASFLELPLEEARRVWAEGFKRHGTTIGWLTREKNFSAVDAYYAFVHPENEADSLAADPALRGFLESLPVPCSILTNSPRVHAERILAKLALEGFFTRIFDIADNAYAGKPDAGAYRRALDALELRPEEALFVDDSPRYVQGYTALGGRGILIDELDIHSEYRGERIKDLKEIVRFLG